MNHFKLPQLRVHLLGYVFSPHWLPTLVTCVCLFLLINLGVWQLHRAAEKKIIEQTLGQHRILTLTQLNQVAGPQLQYRRLQVSGHFDPEHLLFLDNKIYKQQPGVHVFAPFYVTNQHKILLINRGFVPVKHRQFSPKVRIPTGERIVSGLIQFPKNGLILKKIPITQGKWPQVVQTIDLPWLARSLDMTIYPFVLLQENQDEVSLIRDWHPVNFPSYRHTGYAFQWFSLALTLLIIYIALNTSRKKP